LAKLTPEDYKHFHALYNKSHHYKNGQVVPELLENTLNNIKEYESNYYNYVIEKMTQSMAAQNYSTKFEKIINNQTDKLELIYKNNSYDGNNELKKYENKITLSNNQYTWQAYENGELYHQADGTYLEQGNLIIIPSLKILNPSFSVSKYGKVNDLAIVSVILMKQEGVHYLVPIDTLTRCNLEANMILKNELEQKTIILFT
jgi:hypothetical protein